LIWQSVLKFSLFITLDKKLNERMQMKIRILILVLHLLPFVAFCQKTIVPGSREINTSYLKPEKSLYTVYYVKDTSWAKQGTMAYDISFSDNKINLFYKYTEKNNEWSTLRTSIADAKKPKINQL
jgi:hypothetical protein